MDHQLCKVCDEKTAKYTCPRCHLLYCSTQCYQAPSHVKCSEAFYRESVEEELHQSSASSEEKQAILEILKRFEQECADDDEELASQAEIDQLRQRMNGVDLNGDPQSIWENLTQEERDNFMKLVKEDKIGSIVQPWTPWWTYKKKVAPLVQEAGAECPDEELSKHSFPSINTSIVDFSKVSKLDPAPCLRYNTVNILLAYTYIALRYNGEHTNMAIQCAEDLVSISDVLLKSENINSTSEAVNRVIVAVKKLEDLFVSMDFFIQAVDSVLLIIEGPELSPCNDFLLMAMSDIINVISTARKELGKEEDSTEGCKQLFLMKKKLGFYSSWVLSHGCGDLTSLTQEIAMERANLMAQTASVMKQKKKSQSATKKSKSKAAEKNTNESGEPKIVELS